MEQTSKFPTETIELPSEGILYPADSPLASGKLEMKYMTAKEEDILTNQNYIKQGVVIDKVLQSLITTKIDIDDLLIGDKNAIIVASRVLGYGKDYSFMHKGQEVTVDLSILENKYLDKSLMIGGKNEFEFTLPHTENKVTFKLLTEKDQKAIDRDLAGLKKISPNSSAEVSTKLRHTLLSVNGNYDKKDINEFIDNHLLAKDSRELRKYILSVSPDVDLTTMVNINGVEEDIDIPIGLNFFWPDL
jgi:hypothetical protein